MVIKVCFLHSYAEREETFLKRVQHLPYTVKLLHSYSKEGKRALVLKKVTILEKEGYFVPKNIILNNCRYHVPKTELEFNTFTYQLLSTLESLHSLGIVHNDLKLPNCLYDTKSKQVTLIDFDLAEFHQPNSTWVSKSLGTKKFQPPEMVRQKLLDHKMDIWRLGVMLAEIVRMLEYTH